MLSKFERRPVDSVEAVRRTCNVVVDGATFEERGGRFEWVSNAVELEVRHYSAAFLRRLLARTPHVTSLVLRDVDAVPLLCDAPAPPQQDTEEPPPTRCRLQSLTVSINGLLRPPSVTEIQRQAIEDAALAAASAVHDCCDCEHLEVAHFHELPEALLSAFLTSVQLSSTLQDLEVQTARVQPGTGFTNKLLGDIGRCLLRCQSHVEKGSSFVSLKRLWLVRTESLRPNLQEQQRLVEPGDDAEAFTEALRGCKGVIDLNLSRYDFRAISNRFVTAVVESGIAERCWLEGTNPQSFLVSFRKRDENKKPLFEVDHWSEMVAATVVVAGGAPANDPSTNEILSRMRKRLDDEQRPAPASPPSAAATGRTVTSTRAPTVKVMMFSYPYVKKVEILEPLAEPNGGRPLTFPLRYTVSDVGNMSVWDINSQQRYESLRGIYCRASTAALIVLPIVIGGASSSSSPSLEDQKEGFATALRWKREYLDNVSVVKDDKNVQLRDAEDALVFLLVNSEDLAKVMPSSVRGSLKSQIEQFYKSNGFHGLFYVSPTIEGGNSVKRAFEEMLVTILTTCGVRTQREIKGDKEKVSSLFFGAEEEDTWVSNVYGGLRKRR